MAGNDSHGKPDEHVEILDVSEYKPRRIPSKQWRLPREILLHCHRVPYGM